MIQTKREKVERVLNYVLQKRRSIFEKLASEQNQNYKQSYLSSLDDSAKDDMKDIVSMIRWLINDLGVNTPPAFTNQEVDSIDPTIRTKEI